MHEILEQRLVELTATEKRLTDRITALYREFHPQGGNKVSSEFIDAKKKLAQTLSHVRLHHTAMRNRLASRVCRTRLMKMIGLVRSTIEQGDRMLAFDIERGWPDQFGRCETREIGYTIYERGKLSSFNLRSSITEKKNFVGFEFGATERLHPSEMVHRLNEVAMMSSLYIGHSLGSDFHHLHSVGVKLPKRPVVDTFDLALLLPNFGDARDGANLSALAQYYGINAAKPHCGGNDARYNMEVVLAMIGSYK